jgi:hypothetical protein
MTDSSTKGASRERACARFADWVLGTAWSGAAAVLIVLAATGCASGGQRLSGASTGRAGGSVAPAASSQRLHMTSTLDRRLTLPPRVHWQATPGVPSDEIAEVDFLIDGRLGWVEHAAPYYYADDGNWLVTSFLKPGEHKFTVRVLTIQGNTAADTVRARVTAPPRPPTGVAATWTRVVSSADVRQATSGQSPPPGRWILRIDPMGWQLRDPTPGATWGLFDVAYASGRTLQMRSTIEYPPYPNANNGGFCEDTDPLFNWTYTITDSGRTLTLSPVGTDPCGDRIAILEGTWTRMRR